MTPEQKRIMALEATVGDLVNALEEARIGFGSRFANQIRKKLNQDRSAYKFAGKTAPKPTPPEPTPPAAPVESETAA